jgi:hypothetical protein
VDIFCEAAKREGKRLGKRAKRLTPAGSGFLPIRVHHVSSRMQKHGPLFVDKFEPSALVRCVTQIGCLAR